MARSTFILMVSLYGILQGLAQLLIPTFVSKNFGGDPTNNFELALWGFFGIVNIGNSIIFLFIRKTNDNQVLKGFLFMVSFVYFGLLLFSIYNHYGRQLPFNDSSPIDYSIWILLGAGALYYRSKVGK